MKVQKFTISAANLNAGKELDVKLTINSQNFFPTGVRIQNKTGAIVGIIFLTGDNEEDDFIANPGNYDYFPIDNLENYYNDRKLYRVSRFIVKTYSGVAGADLDVYFMGYRTGGIASV
jgi:hypothetical protein